MIFDSCTIYSNKQIMITMFSTFFFSLSGKVCGKNLGMVSFPLVWCAEGVEWLYSTAEPCGEAAKCIIRTCYCY